MVVDFAPSFFRETEMLNFACDYLDGAPPKVFEALEACNYLKTGCYGVGDAVSDAARAKSVKPAGRRRRKSIFFPAVRRQTKWC